MVAVVVLPQPATYLMERMEHRRRAFACGMTFFEALLLKPTTAGRWKELWHDEELSSHSQGAEHWLMYLVQKPGPKVD
jgi:hypothetical protein